MSAVGANPSLCVIASGSSGNCSVVRWRAGGREHAAAIDMGLSRRRLVRDLHALGLELDALSAVFVTHTDSDHWQPGWNSMLPSKTRLLMHRAHARSAARRGLVTRPVTWFDEQDDSALREALDGAPTTHVRVPHDDLGACAFRFDFDSGSLGFATDLGSFNGEFLDAFAGVSVMAIESNHCPKMQARSGRPEVLIRRVLGPMGHLSNEQCSDALLRIAPTKAAVLLHLSRDCNEPELAAAFHAGRAYQLFVSSHDRATPWVEIVGPPRAVQATSPQGFLFEAAR